MNDFKAAASYLLPYNPLSKKTTAGAKRRLLAISEVSGEGNVDISSVSQGGRSKTSIGKSGVEFRYFKAPKYKCFSADQKAELKV
jgi:hypothetical protein